MQLCEGFIKNALDGASIVYDQFPKEMNFSIDTRTIKPGDIFIALKGKNSDGHFFVQEAFDKGAAGCIIQREQISCLSKSTKSFLAQKLVILVPDTVAALVQLATKWREQFTYPVVCITGSVGKTTTKEKIANILTLHNVAHIASRGNQNTMYGLALNILRMRAEHTVAVFEIGISKRGEMAQLARMAKPTIALITMVGHCHMEGLGSIVDIAIEKRDIFKYFKEDDIAIVFGDQPLLAQVAYSHPVIKFGCKTTNQVQARKIRRSAQQTSFALKLYHEKHRVVLNSQHESAVFTALAAATLAYVLKIPSSTILQGLSQPLVINGRFEERPLKFIPGSLINDAYNASPESMKAALSAFHLINTDAQKVVILGDMLELGVNSPFWHRQIGRFLRKTPSIRNVVLVGSMVKWIQKTVPVGVQVYTVPTWQDAYGLIKNTIDKKSLFLVKGSFGTGLTHLVDALT